VHVSESPRAVSRRIHREMALGAGMALVLSAMVIAMGAVVTGVVVFSGSWPSFLPAAGGETALPAPALAPAHGSGPAVPALTPAPARLGTIGDRGRRTQPAARAPDHAAQGRRAAL
jgi:hypothetical protein